MAKKTKLDHLKEKWADGVSARAAVSDPSMPDVVGAFDVLMQAVPQGKVFYADFVMSSYCAGKFFAEDIPLVLSTLQSFEKSKSMLSEHERDIGHYADHRQVLDALERAGVAGEPVKSGKEIKRAERDMAYAESEILKQDGWTMATLKGPVAAQWWGLGTRWCTTEKTGRTYRRYAESGPLRVFVKPNGEKFQLHMASGSLCDAADETIPLAEFIAEGVLPRQMRTEILNEMDDVIVRFIRRLDDVSDPFSSFEREPEVGRDAMMVAVSSLPIEWLERIEPELRDKLEASIIRNSVKIAKENGWFVGAIEDEFGFMTATLLSRLRHAGIPFFVGCAFLVKPRNGDVVYLTFDDAGHAALRKIVADMPTSVAACLLGKMIEKAGWLNYHNIGKLQALVDLFPVDEHTRPVLRNWVKKRGTVPEEYVDADIAAIYAKQGRESLIPDRFINRSIALMMARGNGKNIQNPRVAAHLTDDDYIDLTRFSDGHNFERIPQRLITLQNVIKMAQTGSMKTIQCVSGLVRKGKIPLEGREKSEVLDEIAMAGLSVNGEALSVIDVPLSRSVYLETVRQKPGMLSWVPLPYRDREMCMEALANGTNDVLKHFPKWVFDAVVADGEISERWNPSAAYRIDLESAKPLQILPEKLPPTRCGRPPKK